MLNKGRTGLIYETVATSTDGQGNAILPSLVVKIARCTKNKRIAREAWFYDEMQTLQGVVVPRCYGCFEAKIPDNCSFIPWTEDGLSSDTQQITVPDEEFFSTRQLGAFNENAHDLLTRLEDSRTITLLVLEKLGEPFLPVGVPIPDQVS